MYYFNSFLFNNLPKLFGLSEKGVSEKVYGNHTCIKERLIIKTIYSCMTS